MPKLSPRAAEESAEKKRLALEAKAESKRAREEARRAKAAEYLRAREEQRRNRVERSFNFVIAGLSHEDRYDRVERYCREGDSVTLQRDPRNQHDPYAIRIITASGHEIGFVRRPLAEEMAPMLDDGMPYIATCTKILGGRMGPAPVVDVRLYGKESTLPDLQFAGEWTSVASEDDVVHYRSPYRGPTVDNDNSVIGWAVLIILAATLLFASKGCAF